MMQSCESSLALKESVVDGRSCVTDCSCQACFPALKQPNLGPLGHAHHESIMSERCAICGCQVHRKGDYAKPTLRGRSHATRHHYVAERFFGRSKNRPRSQREAIFAECPWKQEGNTETFCYECHEELLHNPVLLPEDVKRFAELVHLRGLREERKPRGRSKVAGRIVLLREVVSLGLDELLASSRQQCRAGQAHQLTLDVET